MSDLRPLKQNPFRNVRNLEQEIIAKERQDVSDDTLKHLGIDVFDINSTGNVENLNKNGCILFIPIENDHTGHYICVWYDYYKKRWIVFDPYGVPLRKLAMMTTGVPDLLMNLVLTNPDENTIDFESQKKTFATCGRWCYIRLLKKELSHQEFKYWCNFRGLSYDDLVSLLTYSLM